MDLHANPAAAAQCGRRRTRWRRVRGGLLRFGGRRRPAASDSGAGTGWAGGSIADGGFDGAGEGGSGGRGGRCDGSIW